MKALQIIEKKGNDAVQRLRLQKLRSGHPFMINAKDLESNQCYLESSF
jgi:hydrogenase maturation factor HypF (carbamoyltransferase family)